jgi:hypothetical protein
MSAAETLLRRDRSGRATSTPAAAVVLIESHPKIREANRAAMEERGLRVLEPDLTGDMPMRDELTQGCAIIADFELDEAPERSLPYTGLDLAQLIARRAGRRIPTLVISSNFGRQAIPCCSPYHLPVLFRPVHVETLRGWLVMVAALPDGPRWNIPRMADG